MDNFPTFWAMLRTISAEDDLVLTVNWGSATWVSTEGTDEELFDWFKYKGTPPEITITRD